MRGSMFFIQCKFPILFFESCWRVDITKSSNETRKKMYNTLNLKSKEPLLYVLARTPSLLLSLSIYIYIFLFPCV